MFKKEIKSLEVFSGNTFLKFSVGEVLISNGEPTKIIITGIEKKINLFRIHSSDGKFFDLHGFKEYILFY